MVLLSHQGRPIATRSPRKFACHASKTENPVRICVIGAGVVGLSTAVKIKQAVKDAHLTIVAEKFGSDTTTFGAAGIWGPYCLSKTPEEKIHRWGKKTYDYLMGLYHSASAYHAGVSVMHRIDLTSGPAGDVFWKDIPYSFSHLSPQALSAFPGGYTHGTQFRSVVCEGRYYLSFLKKQLEPNTQFLQAKVNALQDLSGYDVLINCCGLGAKDLVLDPLTGPIRGQVTRVRAPWVTEAYSARPYYIIPNRNFVVLGGTTQEGNWNSSVSMEDQQDIWEGCCRILPSLKDAEVVGDWVGLRPGRTELRLERDEVEIDGRLVPVIHNYGHGGAGLTLAWGCADDVVDILHAVL